MGWWGPNIFTPGFSRKAIAQQDQLLEATGLQSSLHHLKVGAKQRGLSFCLPMTHAQSSRAFLLPQARAHPANSSSGARGCPPPYRPRERSCQARQRATLSPFLLRIHPSPILSACSGPGVGTQAQTPRSWPLSLRRAGDGHGARDHTVSLGLTIFYALGPVETSRTAPLPSAGPRVLPAHRHTAGKKGAGSLPAPVGAALLGLLPVIS